MADPFVSAGAPATDIEAISFSAADTDAIMTSVAMVTSAATYSAADLNGIYGNTLINSRRITITLSSLAGSWALSAYTITGLADDAVTAQVESVTNTASSGAVTLTTTNLFAKVTQVTSPANGSTSGTWKVGTEEAPSPYLAGVRSLYIGGAGNLVFTTKDGTLSPATPVAQGVLPISVRRVWASADGTTASSILALK